MNQETIKKLKNIRTFLQKIIQAEDEQLLRFLREKFDDNKDNICNNYEIIRILNDGWHKLHQNDDKQPNHHQETPLAPAAEENSVPSMQREIDSTALEKNNKTQTIATEATTQLEHFDGQHHPEPILLENENSEYQVQAVSDTQTDVPDTQTETMRPVSNKTILNHISTDALAQAKPIGQRTQAPQNTFSLPNANKGKPYEVSLPAEVEILQITPADIGLFWDKETHAISGTPQYSNNVRIKYRYWVNRGLARKEFFENGEQTVFVNPDPKDLWENIPSNQNDRFAKPDQDKLNLTTDEGRLIAARVRGRSHAHKGLFCDDDFALYYDEASRVHLLAVSDGAGSAEFSRLGSQVVVHAVRDTVKEFLHHPEKDFYKLPVLDIQQQEDVLKSLLEQAAYAACAEQNKVAKQNGLALKSLSCTLLVVLTMPAKDGRWLSAAYWVGDGAAALWLPQSQQVILLGEADSGAYSGETRFLSAQEVQPEQLQKRLQMHYTEQKPTVMVMTDGVSDAKFETEARLAQAEEWQKLWGELQEPLAAADSAEALIHWLDFWSPGNHDDRTLALFIPHHAPQNHYQEGGKQ